MRALRHVMAILRRELGASFLSPVALVVLVLFLVVEGYSFWAVLQVLADPRAPAPYGAVLRTHFGGTFLHWAFQFLVASAITMRLVAEERRLGTWESLVTAPVDLSSIVLGKWLGAVVFYAFLWVPTLAYVLVLYAFAPPGAAPEVLPIATAYLGVLLSGAAFLAVGLLASASTSSPIIALVLSFVGLLALLLVGLAPELAPTALARHETLSVWIATSDVRRHLDDFARGVVDLRHVGFYVGLIVCALTATTAVLGMSVATRRQALRHALGVALVLMATILGQVLLARHPQRLDVTRGRVYTLSEKTQQILGEVRLPVRVLVLSAGAPEFAELYDEVRVLLGQFHAAQPLLAVEALDPTTDPTRIDGLAEAIHLAPDELMGGGAVVFVAGARRRAVALLDMAAFAKEGGQAALVTFRGEEAFAVALLDVIREDRPKVCFLSGHGELSLDEAPSGRDLSLLAAALRADALEVGELARLGARVASDCAVLAIVGPRRSLDANEALVVHEWVDRGGRLLVAVDGDLDVPTGLELVLANVGVRVRPAIVVDPDFELGVPLTWATLTGYGDHAVSASFQGRRVTLWHAPRWIESAHASATPLVSSSASGWAETDRAGLRLRAARPGSRDAKDLAGPVSVAVAAEKGEGRVVVLGSALSFASEALRNSPSANAALVTSAVSWLTGRTQLGGIPAKTPEQFRVAMTVPEVERVFYVCVLGLPGLAALAGILLLAWRRRE